MHLAVHLHHPRETCFVEMTSEQGNLMFPSQWNDYSSHWVLLMERLEQLIGKASFFFNPKIVHCSPAGDTGGITEELLFCSVA